MAVNLPECPSSLKPIQHYLKTAVEHDTRDPVVSYWCRLHALQVGLKLSVTKTPEETKLLMGLMDWLEVQKRNLSDNEAITNELAAQAHLENYGLKLFYYADKQDREANFGKNVVKAFYTAGIIFDVLITFGELSEDIIQNRKYAKWKAAYIHNCLKSGETPVPGPIRSEDDEEDLIDQPGPSNAGPKDVPPRSDSADSSPPSGADIDQRTKPTVGGFVPYNNPQGFNAFGNPPDPAINPTFKPISGDTGSNAETPQEFKNPTDFVPYTNPVGNVYQSEVALTADQVAKAQKYCKWASSALTYDDTKTAITNLQKALELLQTGNDPA